MEDVGRWRCQGCGTINGVENEAERIVRVAAKARAEAPLKKDKNEGNGESEEADTPIEEVDEGEDEGDEVQEMPAQSMSKAGK